MPDILSKRGLAIGAVLLVLFLGLFPIGYWLLGYWSNFQEIERCKYRLSQIGMKLASEGLFIRANGERRFPEASTVWGNPEISALSECPTCGSRYKYQPIDANGTRLTNRPESDRVVLWSPCTRPDGRRTVLTAGLAVYRVLPRNVDLKAQTLNLSQSN
jgi:hypothetical protein